MTLKISYVRETLAISLQFTPEGGGFTVVGTNNETLDFATIEGDRWLIPHAAWSGVDTVTVSAAVSDLPKGFYWELRGTTTDPHKVSGKTMVCELDFSAKTGTEFGILASHSGGERLVQVVLEGSTTETARAPRPPRPIVIAPGPGPAPTTPHGVSPHVPPVFGPNVPGLPDAAILDLFEDELFRRHAGLLLQAKPSPGPGAVPRARIARELLTHLLARLHRSDRD